MAHISLPKLPLSKSRINFSSRGALFWPDNCWPIIKIDGCGCKNLTLSLSIRTKRKCANAKGMQISCFYVSQVKQKHTNLLSKTLLLLLFCVDKRMKRSHLSMKCKLLQNLILMASVFTFFHINVQIMTDYYTGKETSFFSSTRAELFLITSKQVKGVNLLEMIQFSDIWHSRQSQR